QFPRGAVDRERARRLAQFRPLGRGMPRAYRVAPGTAVNPPALESLPMPDPAAPAPGTMPANPFFQGLRGNTSDPAHARNPDLPRAEGPTERWSRQQDQLATERGSRSTDVHTRADDGTPLINGRPASDSSGRRDATTPTAAPADAPTTE